MSGSSSASPSQRAAPASAEGVALSLNQDVYRALGAVDASAEDAATKYYLERTLLGYRLAGGDRGPSHVATGGRLIRIASMLPPVFSPNSVPRS